MYLWHEFLDLFMLDKISLSRLLLGKALPREFTKLQHHVIVLLEIRSEIVLLLQLCWIGERRSSLKPYVYEYSEVPHLRHSRRCPWIVFIDMFIYGDLEVGFVESSSSTLVQERNPRVSVYKGM